MSVKRRQDETWTDRTGRVWKIGEMSETHVRNTLRMILRKHRELGGVFRVDDWFDTNQCDATESDIY